MGSIGEALGNVVGIVENTIYRIVDFNSGKFFDVPATDKYFGDWAAAFEAYKNYAQEHFTAMDNIASTNSWMGEDADAVKTMLSDTETTLLEDIIKLHDDINELHATILENFKLTVDSAPDAYISYDDLMQIEKDFKKKADNFKDEATLAESTILDMQAKYSKYGPISTPDFSPGKTAFANLCGDEETDGFLAECRKKLIEFDNDTVALINEKNISGRCANLMVRMGAINEATNYAEETITKTALEYINVVSDMLKNSFKEFNPKESMQQAHNDRVERKFEYFESIDNKYVQKIVDSDFYKGYKNIVYETTFYDLMDHPIDSYIHMSTKLLSYEADYAGDKVKEKGSELINDMPDNPWYYRITNPTFSIFEVVGAIQSYRENGDLSKTDENAVTGYKKFETGIFKSVVDLGTGIFELPDLAYEVGSSFNKGCKEVSDYLTSHNCTDYPEELKNWFIEKGKRLGEIKDNLVDAGKQKLDAMDYEDYCESAGYLTGFIGSFFIGAGEEKVATDLAEVSDVAKAADGTKTLSEVNKAKNAISEECKIAEIAEEAEKISKSIEIGRATDVEAKANEIINESKLSINAGKQGKHIKGHNNYIEGRSIFEGTLEDAQRLVSRYGGTGEWITSNKERIDFGTVIGKYVDPITNEEIETTIGIIHYSKNGTHIVPAKPIH